MFSFLLTTLVDQNLAKLVSEWSVHPGTRGTVLVNDASAGATLRFVAEAAVTEALLVANAVRTYRRTV